MASPRQRRRQRRENCYKNLQLQLTLPRNIEEKSGPVAPSKTLKSIQVDAKPNRGLFGHNGLLYPAVNYKPNACDIGTIHIINNLSPPPGGAIIERPRAH